MQKRLPKSKRAPEAFAKTKITDRSLAVIDTIARYRFILARDIVRLVGGNEDVTHRHLQQLYHRDIISRFSLPSGPARGEFVYFLQNSIALRKLCESTSLNSKHFDWEEISRNRQKYGASSKQSIGQFLFIEHELMISAFHAVLETAAKADGSVELERFEQGASLWNNVQVAPRRTLPHRPDALFTLRFPNASEGQQRANFLYEADRGTSSIPRIREKLIAHVQFLIQGKQEEYYGFRKLRAVLVETLTEERAAQIQMLAVELANQFPLSAMLFWFSNTAQNASTPFARRWSCAADNRLRSVLD